MLFCRPIFRSSQTTKKRKSDAQGRSLLFSGQLIFSQLLKISRGEKKSIWQFGKQQENIPKV